MGSLHKEIKQVCKQISELREGGTANVSLENIGSLELSLEKLLNKEELYWKQWSRNNWVATGDRNTVFSHKTASARKIRNRINSLKRSDNSTATEQKEIEAMVNEYYKSLFATQKPTTDNIRAISDLLQAAVTPDMNAHLDTPFSEEEVKAMFDLNPSKAPGPYGFTTLFFQDAWDIIGKEVTGAVLKVLNNGEPLDDWNFTVITLIPKVKVLVTNP